MFSRTTLRKAILTALTLSAASALVFANRGAAPFKCRTVNGKFSLQSVSGPTCTSPVGLCATGSYSGGIKGNSEFTGSSLVPTVDTPTTSVVLLTGDNIIHTDSGDLLTKDAIVLRTTGAGDFAEVDTVVGGTGDLAGATGQFSATGTFTAAGGEAEYRGEICTP